MGRELRGNREGIAREFGGIGREFPRGGVLKCVYFPRGGLQKMVSKNDLGFSWQRVLGIRWPGLGFRWPGLGFSWQKILRFRLPDLGFRWPGLGFSCLPVCLPAIRALGFSCLSVVLYPKP